MEHHEIVLGPVTYEVCRVYAGKDPAAEVLVQQLVRQASENTAFDGGRAEAV